MNRIRVKPVTGVVVTILLLICLLGGSCGSAENLDSRLKEIAKSHTFSIFRWEFTTLHHSLDRFISSSPQAEPSIEAVNRYFDLVRQLKTIRAEINRVSSSASPETIAWLKTQYDTLEAERASLAKIVEITIEGQIKQALWNQGIFNPLYKFTGLRVVLPQVNFALERPPRLLVVSPRERIETQREIMLSPDISQEEIEHIEAGADLLDVSSLVVNLGGLGATYPALVGEYGSLEFTVETAAEEWLHQYLTFRPLGFLYLLDAGGITRNYEIATMNETAVGIASQEIAALVLEKYYAWEPTPKPVLAPEFDFNREMRAIRLAVDDYLARGEIEQAEAYMEARRQFLATEGYYIRKLNQAYFAFHGTYADEPTSVDPIGEELRQLRNLSTSLREFLDKAAGLTSRRQLQDIITDADVSPAPTAP